MAGAALQWCALLALWCLLVSVTAVPPKVVSSKVAIKEGEAAGGRVTLAQYTTDVDQDLHVLQMQACPPVLSCPPVSACAPCNYASKAECARIVNPVGQPDEACLLACDPSLCDVDIYGDWEEVTLLNSSVVVDFDDDIKWPNFIARYRVYVPQGQPYCNMSLFVRISGGADSWSSYSQLVVSSTPFLNELDVADRSAFPWYGGRGEANQLYICPTDVSPLYTDGYSAGTFYLYPFFCGGKCTLTVKMQAIAGGTAPEDMTWCDAFLSTLPPALAGYSAELLDDGVVDADSTAYKCIESDRTYNYFLQDQFNLDLLARVDGPCPRFFGIVQSDDSTLIGRNLFVSLDGDAFIDVATAGIGDILFDYDYSPRYFALSFCPQDGSIPTWVTMHIDGDGPFRVFYTKNRARFEAWPLSDFGDPVAQSFVMQNTVMFKLPNSATAPWCSRLCVYNSDPCSCQGQLDSLEARAEVSPFYPPPDWYVEKTGLFPPVPPSWQVSPYVGARTFSYSLVTEYEIAIGTRLINIPLFTGAEIATSSVYFMSRLSLVNSLKEDFRIDIFHPDAGQQVTLIRSNDCTATAYRAIKQQIDDLVSQLTNASVVLTELTYQLDTLNYRDSYVACKNKATTLLTEVSRSQVQDSSACLVYDEFNPCCSDDSEWYSCCGLSLQNVTTVSFTASEDAVLAASCPQVDTACLKTFLDDYTFAEQTSCSGVIPYPNKWRFTQCVNDWFDCSNKIFGERLMGEECTTDADCASGFCNPPYTPYISRSLRTLSAPRGQRRVCQESMKSQTTRFLHCLADSGSAVFQDLIVDYPAPTLNESIDSLIADLLTVDCIAPSGVAFEAGYRQHRTDNEPPCITGCEYYGMGPYFQSTYDCNQGQVVTKCGAAYEWFVESALPTCTARRTCNWYDCVNQYLNNSACNATCMSLSGVCAICRNDNTCFNNFAAYDATVTDQAACSRSSGCQLANGTIVNLAPAACQATFSCNVPCWDALTLSYRPCASADQCLNSGSCDDGIIDNPIYPSYNGSCITPPAEYYGATCSGIYQEFQYVTADTVGCVIYDMNKTECDSYPYGGVWRTRARTQGECSGVCGCLKDSSSFENWQVEFMLPPYPSTPAECAACDPPQICQPYHTWTPGRWEAGSPRTLQWLQPALIPAYQLRADAFDWDSFWGLWDGTCSTDGPLWRSRSLTYNQCRFNRIAPSLEAVACSCSPDGGRTCLDEVVTSLPIGVGEPCPLVPQLLKIPPHTMEFVDTSVLAEQDCTPLVAYLVPQSEFANSAPSQRLSSYFAPKRQSAKSGEFLNDNLAIVGEVIGDGVLLEFYGEFTDITLCLDVGTIAEDLPLRRERFPILDLAFQNDTFIAPLGLAIDTSGGGYCGTIAVMTEGVYVPVLLVPDWQTAEPKGLTKGEKAVLALAAALYFASVAFYPPYYCLQFVQTLGIRMSVSVSLFWLPILLAAANILRGVYFALLAAELLSDQTYVDVLLVELPTFIWFTASSLMVLFWLVFLASIWNENSVPRIRRLKRAFWITFFVANGVMYALFVAFVVVFSQLKDRDEREQCSGRLPPNLLRRPKRIAFIVYQSVLAFIALFLAIAHVIAGPLLSRRLSRVNTEKKTDTRNAFKLVVVAVIVAIAFALHAIFIFVLALTNPGIPYLVLVLLVLDLIPTVILLWQLPAPALLAATTSTSSSKPPSSNDGATSASVF